VTGRAWLLVPIAAIISTLAFAGVGVGQARVDADEFLARLRRAQGLAQLAGVEATPERMADLRAEVGLPVEVAIGESAIQVPSDPVLAALTGSSEADFSRAHDRLAALERSLTDALAREPIAASEIDAALRSAYSGVAPPRPNVLELIWQAVGEAIQAVLVRIGDALARAGNALAWVALIAIAALAIAFLLRGRLVPDRVARTAGGVVRAGSVDWSRRAEDALRAGNLHEAVRALYMGLLTALVARGILADVPALTAGEARHLVQRARPGLFPAVARATDAYERVVYGGATPDARDVEALRKTASQALRP
jgi:hypothetical protein